MLAKSASEVWHENPETEIFIDRYGTMFSQVLNYLRDSEVNLPRVVNREAFLKELAYYGVENVDENSIEDEFNRSKAGANVLLMKEASIIHGLVNRIIDHFLSPKHTGTYFTLTYQDHLNNYIRNHDANHVQAALNVHLQKLGLKVTHIDQNVSLKVKVNVV